MNAVPQPQPFAAERRWKRYDIHVPVRLIVHHALHTSRISGRGTELNQGGMCIFAGAELSLGEQVELEFTAPYCGDPLRIWCVVRNRSGYYYGLEFLAENAGEREQVTRFREILRSSVGA
jgi:hypothetical protein